MKKQITAIILSALLLANAAACDIIPDTPEQETESTAEGTTTTSPIIETPTLPDNEDNSQSPVETLTPVRSSYVGSSTYIQMPNNLFIKEIDDQRYFYMPEWEKTFEIPDDFDNNRLGVCGFVGSERAWIFEYEHEQSENTNYEFTIFTMFIIHRERGIEAQRTLSFTDFPYRGVDSVFYSMTSENTGFLFVFQYNKSKNHLAALLKTTDGGEHWTRIEPNESWYSGSWKNILIVAHFFDENKGMIVPRTAATVSINHVYITLDGGKNWRVAHIPIEDYDSTLRTASDRYLELNNFEYSDGQYRLTFRLRGNRSEIHDMVSFTSTDLITWIYLP